MRALKKANLEQAFIFFPNWTKMTKLWTKRFMAHGPNMVILSPYLAITIYYGIFLEFFNETGFIYYNIINS